MVLIKISEVPHTKEALKERTRRAWRVNPSRLYNQEQLMVVYKGQILEVYKINGYHMDEEEPTRVAFEIEEIPSDLRGKKIKTWTSNPCTIVDVNELEFL